MNGMAVKLGLSDSRAAALEAVGLRSSRVKSRAADGTPVKRKVPGGRRDAERELTARLAEG